MPAVQSYDDGAGVAWRVINVQDGQGQDATGRYVNGKTVTFQLSTGHSGTVFVPGGQSDVATVRAMVQQEAANLAAITALSSG
jgi:hypothetical protein